LNAHEADTEAKEPKEQTPEPTDAELSQMEDLLAWDEYRDW
jgi:hypothetical protein